MRGFGLGVVFLVLGSGAGSPLFGAPPQSPPRRPNIVLVLTDDAGYSDLGCYGAEFETPVVDRLARNGLRFAKVYNNARCSPSRASLLTGRYAQAVGVGDLCTPGYETPLPGYRGRLSRGCVTAAELLAQAGYHTLMAGKWHLGGERKFPSVHDARHRPLARGFERFFGLIGGAADYFRPEPGAYRLGDEPFVVGEEDDFYATDAITDRALGFVDEVRAESDAPFFLYVAYTAPHLPLGAPEHLVREQEETYRGSWEKLRTRRRERLLRDGLMLPQWHSLSLGAQAPGLEVRPVPEERVRHMATVAAMLERVDWNVGRIVDRLEELGELEDTLIVFLSDNGGIGWLHNLSVTPFGGTKTSLHEGGISTHCVVHWPRGLVSPGRITREGAHVIDFLPTFLELAGAPYPRTLRGRRIPPMDGKSLVPILRDERWPGHEMLFFDLYGQKAVIQGRWKWYLSEEGVQLHDLQADGAETRNLAGAFPRKVAELEQAHAAWARRCSVVPFGDLFAFRKSSGFLVAFRPSGSQAVLSALPLDGFIPSAGSSHTSLRRFSGRRWIDEERGQGFERWLVDPLRGTCFFLDRGP